MARQLRIQFEGALYHITDRGLERRRIFKDSKDYDSFLSYLHQMVSSYHLVIHAFCLMPNHYHLECETPNSNLSEAMQCLNTSYTVYFNRRHVRSGHLFQGRYKAILVEKESHLLELSRYIHMNPVRAKLVEVPEDYPWSSYQTYLDIGVQHQWISVDWTLSQFGKTLRSARLAYRNFVEEGLKGDLEDPVKGAVAGIILGNDHFVEQVKNNYLKDRPINPEQPSIRRLQNYLPIQEIIEETSKAFQVNVEEIIQKGRHGNIGREIAIYISRRYSGKKNVEIGREFGNLASSNISCIFRKVEEDLKRDESIRMLYNRIIENLIYKV